MTWFTSFTFARAVRPRGVRPWLRSAPLFGGHSRQLNPLFEDLVDEAVAHRLLPVHEAVAVGVLLDAIGSLAGVLGQDLVQPVARLEHFLGMNLHIRRLSLKAAEGLVNHHARVREAVALAARAAGEEHGPHAGRLADADGADVRLDELHGVVDRQSRAHDAARGIDVERNVLVGVLGLEEQHLRDHDVGHVVIDLSHDEDHPLLEETGIDVISPLAPRGLLDHDGDQIQATLVHVPLASPWGSCWGSCRGSCWCGASSPGLRPNPVRSLKLVRRSVTRARSRRKSTTRSSRTADSMVRIACGLRKYARRASSGSG